MVESSQVFAIPDNFMSISHSLYAAFPSTFAVNSQMNLHCVLRFSCSSLGTNFFFSITTLLWSFTMALLTGCCGPCDEHLDWNLRQADWTVSVIPETNVSRYESFLTKIIILGCQDSLYASRIKFFTGRQCPRCDDTFPKLLIRPNRFSRKI